MAKIFFITCFLFLLASCSSAPTKDVCSLEKHDQDDLYQVKINDEAINKFWYLKEDAIDITKMLAQKNMCMARPPKIIE
jgi:hypothetical protein